METLVSLYDLMFWATVFFTVVGAILGLIGVWVRDFWRSEFAVRLLLTDLIFAGTSLIVALIIKFLG